MKDMVRIMITGTIPHGAGNGKQEFPTLGLPFFFCSHFPARSEMYFPGPPGIWSRVSDWTGGAEFP